MANKKISQLSATTESNDNVWIVMNNSGNTETFRIKRVDFLSGTTTPPGLVNGTGSDSLKSADYLTPSIPPIASGTQSIALGYDTTATQLFSVCVGAQSEATGQASLVLGAGNESNSQRGLVVGFLSKANAVDAITIGAESSTTSTGAITIGKWRSIPGSSTGAINIGYGLRSVSGNFSINLGGNNTGISSTGVGNVNIGGLNVNITGTTNYTTFLNLQTPPSTFNSNTTYVDNIHTQRTETFDVINGGNVGGDVDVDCSLGTIFTFTMTADTTPNFINLRTGQRFIFIINNTTFNVLGAEINGVSGNVYAKNGSISPSNNAVSKYTATYDGTRLFLDEELNFSAV